MSVAHGCDISSALVGFACPYSWEGSLSQTVVLRGQHLRLLIIEDNSRLSELLAEHLGVRGFRCDPVENLQSAHDRLSTAAYDLILLDLGLPDGDGLDWLRDRAGAAPLPPTLVLTARNALDDRVAGLNAGADDYLTKPFEFDELVARLRALLRRPGLRHQSQIQVGPLKLDPASRICSFKDATLDLSRREADLLELLMRNADSVVPREVMSGSFYGPGDISINAVEAIVSRVRRKIEAAGGHNVVHTIRGVGYMLRVQ